MFSQQRREEAGGETGGHQEEVVLNGNMSIPKALCVCVCTVYIIVPMSEAAGCWYEHKRCQSGQHVCMSL